MDTGSADAIVTDPPYGLSAHTPAEVAEALSAWLAGRRYAPTGTGFMGKAWDAFVPGPEVWRECFRVLKPGGHMAVFSGTRTIDLMGIALRLAGFEVRDTLTWLYGQGFPKSHNASKAIDKAAGAEREDLGVSPNWREGKRDNGQSMNAMPNESRITMPATDEARQWNGWGTALKPGYEPILLARKPLIGTVAENLVTHGTGAINVDACRISSEERPAIESNRGGTPGNTYAGGVTGDLCGSINVGKTTAGRWPANVVLSHTPECRCVGTKRVKGVQVAAGTPGFGTNRDDNYIAGSGRAYNQDETVESWECAPDCPVRMLDEQSGRLSSGVGAVIRATAKGNGRVNDRIGAESRGEWTECVCYGDSGGASRFFYTAKASRADRGATISGRRVLNRHPTVKPLRLMQWLVRLLCPPEGLVLDPFMGSGTTGLAALSQGFRFVGIEQDLDYVKIARRRLTP